MKVGDLVKVIRGKNKGKRGIIIECLGINMVRCGVASIRRANTYLVIINNEWYEYSALECCRDNESR
jgi:ribosomal protein L24